MPEEGDIKTIPVYNAVPGLEITPRQVTAVDRYLKPIALKKKKKRGKFNDTSKSVIKKAKQGRSMF